MTFQKRTLQAVLQGLMVALAGAAVASAQRTPLGDGPPQTTVFFPLDEVRPGLAGVAYTVFEGVRPEAMSIEILGRLKNALGPGRDLILARLHGSRPEYTGVVAGMSGSPVYVDGKLLGALSYRIGQFSKEPIAGITPIGQMLEVAEQQRQPGAVASGKTTDLLPMEAPLVFSGFSDETVARFGEPFRAMGLLPVRGLGAMDSTRRQFEPLQPGSAVSAVLVQGDLSVTGTCTVSYVDATHLLACGHPLTQTGAIDLPMAKAEVLATLASPLNSFKIVNATEVVGAFQEDRSSAISGRIGAKARMIPVTIAMEPAQGPKKTVHLEVANHRELTPQLLMAAVYQSLQQVVSGSTETSYRMSGKIRVEEFQAERTGLHELPAVKLEGWQTQSGFNSGAAGTALAVGERVIQVLANTDERGVLSGIDLHIETSDRRRSATIDAALSSAVEVKPGDSIEIQATLQPYQQASRVLRLRVQLPETLEPGTLRLLVSDGATLDRLLEPGQQRNLTLADAITRMNAAHGNDRVYVTLLDHAAQAVLDGGSLPDVPLSMANVLEPLKNSQRLRLTGESVQELGSIAADNAVSGSQILSLVVR